MLYLIHTMRRIPSVFQTSTALSLTDRDTAVCRIASITDDLNLTEPSTQAISIITLLVGAYEEPIPKIFSVVGLRQTE